MWDGDIPAASRRKRRVTHLMLAKRDAKRADMAREVYESAHKGWK